MVWVPGWKYRTELWGREDWSREEGLSLKTRSRAKYVKIGLRTSKENGKVKRRRLWVLRMKSSKVDTKKAM